MTRNAGRSRRGPGGPKHAARIPFALVVSGLVFGALALLLALNTASAANELRRHDLALRDEAIAAQVEQLQIEVADSAAPGNLASAAAALGMVPAGDPAFIVRANGRLIVRGRPQPVPYPVVPLPTTHHPGTTAASTTAASSTAASSTAASTSPASSTTAGASRTRAGRHARTTSTSSSAAPSTPTAPSATPTPTVTLPGGPR